MKPADNKKNDAITDEAADWFQAMRDDKVPEATRARFADWLVQSPAHGAEYLRLVELWDDLGDIDNEHRIDVQALIDEAAADTNVSPLFIDEAAHDKSGTRSPLRRLRWPAGIAAALALFAGFLWFTANDTGNDVSYATSLGEQRSFSLDDGSIIHLNTQSEIRVRFEEDARRIELTRGEALFDVASDVTRPFIVQDSNLVAQALGTRFNVYRRERDTQVTVIEGSVAVSAQQQAAATDTPSAGGRITALPRVELRPGEQAEVGAATRNMTTSRVNVERVTAWTTRRLVFDADELRDVVEQFNRYNQTELRLAGDALAARQITGTFNANDPENLVDVLRKLVDIDVERLPDGTLLLKLQSPDIE